jgi:hydroxymethylglutaryl-CoA synthase
LVSGIVSYGVYIPRFRIRVDEIARVWGDDESVSEGLRVFEKSVPDLDEDAVTIAVEAARNALQRPVSIPIASELFMLDRRATLMQ